MRSPDALGVEDLAKSFDGFQAVDGVSFRVGSGEVVALIGPNGAGKTTTFNLINGQLKPDRGRVMLEGLDVTGRTPRQLWRRGMARTFQITATFATMTVAENIAVGLAALPEASGLWSPHLVAVSGSAKLDALIQDVGLEALADRACATLAYGDLKRVELAMALASEPRLLLMDEPTAGMAAAARQALMELAVGAARRRGAAILFTEHDMDIVFGHAERVLVMNRGALIADGTPDAIRGSALVRDVYLGRGAAGRDGTVAGDGKEPGGRSQDQDGKASGGEK